MAKCVVCGTKIKNGVCPSCGKVYELPTSDENSEAQLPGQSAPNVIDCSGIFINPDEKTKAILGSNLIKSYLEEKIEPWCPCCILSNRRLYILGKSNVRTGLYGNTTKNCSVNTADINIVKLYKNKSRLWMIIAVVFCVTMAVLDFVLSFSYNKMMGVCFAIGTSLVLLTPVFFLIPCIIKDTAVRKLIIVFNGGDLFARVDYYTDMALENFAAKINEARNSAIVVQEREQEQRTPPPVHQPYIPRQSAVPPPVQPYPQQPYTPQQQFIPPPVQPFPQQPFPQPTQTISANAADQLLKYAELVEKGLMTKEEFDDIKAKILNK